ncbi:hypothetical protein A7X67_01145 [Clostridium sp. W14A]|nr:hypothetical protein A7X67_01145 [Clostridium sp. W14A]
MEKKNLRKTEGLPFTLGIAAGVVLLLETILSFNLSPIITDVTLSSMGLKSSAASSGISGAGLIGTIISFLIVPGIFLLLLILGKNKEKRGSAFAIVWIVIAGLYILSGLFSMLKGGELQQQITAAVDAVMPGGYWIENALSLIGCGLIIASCVVFWRRLHEPPVFDEPESEPQNGETPPSDSNT